MLVYILFGVAIVLCIGSDYLVNKKRREDDDPLRMHNHSGELEIIKVNRAVNSSSGITSAKTGKPTRNHRWTDKEKQFLVNNFKEISAKNIAKCKEMGGRHTVNAIYKMAARLGLTAKNI